MTENREHKKCYFSPIKENWKGRSDGPQSLRFHEVVQCVDLQKNQPLKNQAISHEKVQHGLIGFCSDEGIKRNLGRIGAALGPASFRKALSNLPSNCSLYDFGDIHCIDRDLETAQQALAHAVEKIFSFGIHPIVIGGGHELAWGHYQGIQLAQQKRRCAIVNIDAHFDLRSKVNDQGTSGTSFLQIAHDCETKQQPFDYTCIGIQQLGNTSVLFQQAKNLGVTTISAAQMHSEGISPAEKLIDKIIQRADMIYLTICLDAFAIPFAPGVSAPQPLGLFPWQVIPLITQLMQSGKVVSFDVAELSPPHDRDDATARLAAALVATALKGN